MNAPASAASAMTFEQIDQHIGDFDFQQYMAGATPAAAGSPDRAMAPAAAAGLDLGKFCPVYGKVKPILTALLAFPLIPEKWKTGIRTLTSLLDAVCP
ncbi:hypothetical protein [Hymenobacter sp. CRA2]|uniref:hypothetical protein n=1 Tax=Hymenobacter sp. CRA2 TaxID=1955620 RepID=UPI001116F464|nr:hypothetical protein [Hymenobacter sp. CRA2]